MLLIVNQQRNTGKVGRERDITCNKGMVWASNARLLYGKTKISIILLYTLYIENVKTFTTQLFNYVHLCKNKSHWSLFLSTLANACQTN